MSSPPSDSNSPPSDSNSPPSDSPPSSNSSPPSSNSSPPSDSSSSPPSSPPPSPPSDSSPSPPSNSSPPPSPPSNSNSSPPPSNSSPPPSPPSDSSPPPSPPSNSSPPPSPPSNSSPPPSPPSNSNPSPPPPSNNTPPPSSDSNSPPPPSHNNPPPSNNNHNPPPSNNNHNPPPSQNRNSPPQVPHTPPSPPSRAGLLTPSALSDDSSSSSSNSKSIIIGAAAGAGLLVFILIAFVVACVRRKKRRQMDNMNYYRDNSRSNGYYNPGLHGNSNWNNNLHPPTDHMMKMPPPPGSAQVSSEHGWAMAPPPPPPMMQSSDMSSMGFSGPHQNALPPPHPAMALGFNQSTFTYEELAAATNGFAQSHLLGQGGFGYVHKGVLPNGKEVAVKSLKANSGQGEREFQAEVDIISRVHHRHLVSLVGYCITGAQRMLVYEFVSNGTLEYHLHGTGRPVMEWSTRHKIAMGSAKGFAYLHEDCHPRIIHRDIKTANILIDDHFEAKVADFGLAKLSSENFTHVSTRIMGTFGYLAPEYASSGKLTEKSDVYSYGIMLLELITGRRPVDLTTDDDNDTLVDWARPILVKVTEGEMESYVELVDPRLGNNYDPQEMLRMVASAAACVRHSARRRPKMSQIVRALEGDVSLEDLNEGVKTGHQALYGSGGSSSSYADLKRIGKPGALSSAEFNSGEHTGEFL